ncbi:MAG: hypothetical protein GY854_23310 [Deltaproteobacteria bacterium]|nr:hypothetical protein [Deltaproteobacteria bacterium]
MTYPTEQRCGKNQSLNIFLVAMLVSLGCHKIYSLDPADSGAGVGDTDTNASADADADSDSDSDSDTDSDTDLDTDSDSLVEESGPMIEACWATSIAREHEGNTPAALAHTDGHSFVAGSFGKEITFEHGKPEEITFTWDAGAVKEAYRSNGFAALYGLNGTLAWARHISSSSEAHVSAVAELPGGDVLIAGDFVHTVTLNPQDPVATELTTEPEWWHDIFIARFSIDGSLVWARRDGGTAEEYGLLVVALPDESIVFVGRFSDAYQSLMGQGEENETALSATPNSRTIFVAKYNPDGLLDWAKTIDLDWASEITVQPDGSFLILGGFWSFSATFGQGEPNETSIPQSSALPVEHGAAVLAHYEPDGTLLWARGVSASTDTTPWGEAEAPDVVAGDNSFMLTGVFAKELHFHNADEDISVLSTVDCDANDGNCRNAFTAGYDKNGGLVETTTYQAYPTYPYESRVAFFSDQSFLTGGGFQNELVFDPGGANETTLIETEWAAFIAHYEKSGALNWAGRLCSRCLVYLSNIATADDGSAIVLGDFGWEMPEFPEPEFILTNGETVKLVADTDDEVNNLFIARLCP